MVIYVPTGSADDPTNPSEDFDATAQFLLSCGVLPLDQPEGTSAESPDTPQSLFG